MIVEKAPLVREINAARLSNAPAAHEMNTCGIREMQHKCCAVAEIIKLCVLHFASEINAISLVISTERKRAEKSRRCHCPSLLLRDVSTALNMTMAERTRLRRHFTAAYMPPFHVAGNVRGISQTTRLPLYYAPLNEQIPYLVARLPLCARAIYGRKVRISADERAVAGVNLFMKFHPELFHAVVFVGAMLALEGALGRDIQKYRQVGRAVFKCERVDVRHIFLAQSPCNALIGERGMDVAVAYYKFTRFERGDQFFL